jgi:hypothetical protein
LHFASSQGHLVVAVDGLFIIDGFLSGLFSNKLGLHVFKKIKNIIVWAGCTSLEQSFDLTEDMMGLWLE